MPTSNLLYIQCDSLPGTIVGSQVLKQAVFNVNLQGRKDFWVEGFDWVSQISPSTPSGLYSPPFRSEWALQYIAAREVFTFAVGPTNPTIAYGSMTGHQLLAGDGATQLCGGSIRFGPVLVRRADFALSFQWRTSSELGPHDVKMLIREME